MRSAITALIGMNAVCPAAGPSHMSACIPSTTAGASRCSAASKIRSIQASAAASRATYSRARSAVSAGVSGSGAPVTGSLRSPNHGAWPSLEPTTWTIPYFTAAASHMTFSGNARDWARTWAWAPSVCPGLSKNSSRSFARRSVGTNAPLLARWQSVHSLSPGV